MAAAVSAEQPLGRTSMRVACNLLARLWQGLLASIDGKKKMSTMEKSRHDWGNFKDKQDDKTRVPPLAHPSATL